MHGYVENEDLKSKLGYVDNQIYRTNRYRGAGEKISKKSKIFITLFKC